jgi:hypothetical protein
MGVKRNGQDDFCEKATGKGSLGRPTSSLEDNIKTNLKELE